jgi:Bacterial PH domain
MPEPLVPDPVRDPLVSGTVVIRPRKVRRVCWVLAPSVALLFAVLATLLRGPTGGDSEGVFQPGDQIAMIVLGLLAGAAILVFTRPKVVADERHIRVQNVLGGYDLPWSVVRRIRFDKGNPWVSLELEDDEVVAVMAVQAADKEHAVAATRQLRALLAAAHAAASPR